MVIIQLGVLFWLYYETACAYIHLNLHHIAICILVSGIHLNTFRSHMCLDTLKPMYRSIMFVYVYKYLYAVIEELFLYLQARDGGTTEEE